MKRVFVVAAVLSALVANADYMMWTIDTSDGDTISAAIKSEAKYMRVGYVTEDGNQPLWTGTPLAEYTFAGGEAGVNLDFAEQKGYKVDLTGLDKNGGSYSFYIELLNSKYQVIARTGNDETFEYVTYDDLVDGNYITYGDIGVTPQANVFQGGEFTACPEPSSMALLALGAGLVGLRRKLKKGKKEKRA